MKSLQNYAIILALVLLANAPSFCQQTDLKKELQIEQLAESMAASEDGTSESTLLLEDLSYYLDHPIYINKATEEELLRLSLFNFKQVRDIITYREKYGEILTLNELTIMGNFSEELLQKMEPLVNFSQDRDSLQKKWDNVIRQSMLFRIKQTLPVAVGYAVQKGKQPVYSGQPFGSFARYRAEIGRWLEIGITAENDAGEDFFRKSNRQGFDFLSGFVCYNGKGFLRKVIVGDYHLRFGQGINLWSGGGVSYTSDLSSLMRSGEGVRPYSSSDENLFFRGVSLQLDLRPLKLSLFYSDKHRDANLEPDSNGINRVTSFRLDGLHRTIAEIEDEKDVRERMLGGYGDFRFNRWRFGMLFSLQRFGIPVSNGDLPYKAKSFEGDTNGSFGLDYHLILNQLSFFGEAGLSQNLKPAFVNGMVWKAHPQFSLSMLYRFYDPAFQTFNSGAFARGSNGRNEEGLFAAFEFLPLSKVKIGAQADLFYFPWMTFQTISPAQGKSCAFQSEWAITRNLMVYLHGRFVEQPQKSAGATGIPEQWDESTAKWRLHCDWKINEFIQLRTRLEYVNYNYREEKEQGFLLFQDLIYSVTMKLKSWIRLACYSTEGYNSRVYAYENDLLYYFAIPEFHGKGVRSYLNLKWQPCKLMTFYFKGGYTLRNDATIMGSGNDATEGNHRFDLRAQLCLKF